MLVAKLFLENKERESRIRNYSIVEFSILSALIIVYIMSFIVSEEVPSGIYYSPIFIIGIYIFSQGKGWISHKILKNNVLIKMACFSFEFYMVHELILIIFRKIFINIQYHWLKKNIIISIPAFIISILIAKFLNQYIKSFNIRKKVGVS
ncbi:hypothetical protein GNF80_04250 [Clostridium perfringens]|nr:hypothetical protein [Clostridium perfringens]